MDWSPFEEDTLDFLDSSQQNYASYDSSNPFQPPLSNHLNL